MDKEIIKKRLQEEEPFVIKFTKTDGSYREMLVTLNPKYLPTREDNEGKPKRKQNNTIQVVYDMELQQWRSFKWENVIYD